MTTSTSERTLLPPAEPLDALVAMLAREDAEPSTTLVGPNGERLVLPPEVFEVLRDVVDAMAQGQAVTIAPCTGGARRGGAGRRAGVPGTAHRCRARR